MVRKGGETDVNERETNASGEGLKPCKSCEPCEGCEPLEDCESCESCEPCGHPQEGAVPGGCAACRRTKARGEREYRDLINRLKRVEGQVRGIRGMIERGAYCADVLIQVAAASAALNSFTRVLLSNHIKTCVACDIREGRDETVDELISLLQRLMR